MEQHTESKDIRQNGKKGTQRMTDRYFIKLSPDGKTKMIYDKGTDHTLKTLQDAVGGQIETVGSTLGEAVIIILNQEGKLEGLQLNRVATSFAVIRSYDYIVGDAVFAIRHGEDIVGFEEDDAEVIAEVIKAQGELLEAKT